MEKFTFNELKQLFSNNSNTDKNLSVHEVFTDSRKSANQALFVPIIGENFDGHDFIKEAINQGAIATLASRKDIDAPDDFPVFYVEDTIKALQDLASFYRDIVDPVVIGVTGSNGKTTTKEIIAQSISVNYKVWKTQGNLNNHIGLPLTVLQMEKDTTALVVEMGMSGFGEIEELSNMVKPNYAVITNIGESHIEYLGSREGIAKAKLEITSGLKVDGSLILDGDEPLLDGIHHSRQISCGFSQENDYHITDVQIEEDQTKFKLNGQPFEIPLLGKHQAKNATFALVLSELLNLDMNQVKETLSQVKLPSMRFEILMSSNGAKLINDAYNASATSMIASIEVLKSMNSSKKIVVLGDILELGSFKKEEHIKVGECIDGNIDAVYTTGQDSRYILDGLPEDYNGDYKHFTNRDNLVGHLNSVLDSETAVLFKASRGIQLEEIVKKLL